MSITCVSCQQEDDHPRLHLLTPILSPAVNEQGEQEWAWRLGFETHHHDCAAGLGHEKATLIVRHTDNTQGAELAARLEDPEHPVHDEVRQHTLREAASIHVANLRTLQLEVPTAEELIAHFGDVNPDPSDSFVNHVTNLVGLQMSGVKQGRGTNWLNAELGSGSFTARTGNVLLQLTGTVGSQSANSTPVSGGSYTDQICAFGSASNLTGTYSAQIANSGTPTYTGMPTTTVNGIELVDAAGTPVHLMYGTLSSPRVTSAGDTVATTAGAIVVQV
jgi:hypothetical protein